MYCKSCGIKIIGDTHICPHCKFNFEKPRKRMLAFPDIAFKPIHFWACSFWPSAILFLITPIGFSYHCSECFPYESMVYFLAALFFGVPLKIFGATTSSKRNKTAAITYLVLSIIFKCFLSSILIYLDFSKKISYPLILFAGLVDCLCAIYLIFSINKQERIIAKRLSIAKLEEEEQK